MSNSSSSSSGIGVFGLIGVLFVGLKLTGFIDWSWWWVTVPFWGGFALIAVILLVGFLVIFLKSYISKSKSIQNRKSQKDKTTKST